MTDDGGTVEAVDDGGTAETFDDGEAVEADAGDDPGRVDAHPIDGVVDRPAASAGVLAAVVAVAATSLPWTDARPLVPPVAGEASTVAAVAAVVAALTFLARRHDLVDRRGGAVVAGVASALVVLVALVRFVAPEARGNPAPTVGPGLPLAAGAGLLALGMAVAEFHDVTASGLLERARRLAVGFGLLMGVFVLASLVVTPFAMIDLGLIADRVVRTVVFDGVLVAVVLAFLVQTGRGLGFLDVRLPGRRDVGYAVAGYLALVVGWYLIVLLVTLLDLPATGNQVVEGADRRPELLLVLIPLQFLAVAPAEELFNRNLLQKYFYGAFSRPAAIVLAGGLFSSAHLFSYSGDSAAGTIVSISIVLILGMVLGVVYERTENVVVPIVAHGAYNATLFGLYYVVVTQDLPGAAAFLPQ